MATVELRPEDIQYLLSVLRGSPRPMTIVQLAETIKATAARAGS
ncbi:MAG: hypothetical protein WKF80_02780 [Thermomicrobiales bacterium]